VSIIDIFELLVERIMAFSPAYNATTFYGRPVAICMPTDMMCISILNSDTLLADMT